MKKRLSGYSVLSDMIPVILTIIITGILGIMFSMWIGQFEQKEAVNSVVREYLLKMETVGYLSQTDRNSLKQELNKYNVKNISFSGTTVTPVENGEKVCLKITGVMKVKYLHLETLFHWTTGREAVVPLVIERTATALY